MAEQIPTRDEIEASIAAARKRMQAIGLEARENAWSVKNHGILIGERGHQMYSGPNEWEAPKVHPVWADELRYETETLRRMGEAGSQNKKPWETDYDKWPSRFDVEREQRHEHTKSQQPEKEADYDLGR